MAAYDAIIVLRSKPDTTSWRFPTHVYASLDEAASLWHQKTSPYIIVSGRHALSFDRDGIQQPFSECDELARYLSQQGVPDSAILRENDSKDTIANLFYMKRLILRPKNLRKLLIVAADFRIERLRYLAQKVFGPEYDVIFRTAPSLHSEANSYNEPLTLARTKEFLKDMTDGDDSFLKGKFYDAPYYNFTPNPNNIRIVGP